MTNTTYTHLSHTERQELFLHRKKGYSLRSIAVMMGRSHSTLSREVKRNSKKVGYDPLSAKHKAYVRRKYSKFQWMKIQGEKELQKYIIEKLKKGWAPQMISGRLKYIDSHLTYVSRQAIYDWLYSAYGQRYCQYLPSKQTRVKRRWKQGEKKRKRDMIPDRVCLSQRPEEANERLVVWHWEADTIVSGKKTGSKVALCTLVDRRSRYTRMRRIENLKPESMNRAIEESIWKSSWLPCKTITYDNGIENRGHMRIRSILWCLTFFCCPYHSWEKWTNENTNGRIRRYIPKWSDIGRYSKKEIQAIEDWLNHTPKACLNYKTPFEVMQEEIQWGQYKMIQKQKNTNSLFRNYELPSGALQG